MMADESIDRWYKIKDLIHGDGPQLVLPTFGFGVYPVDLDGGGKQVCPGIAFPTCPLHRHRPRLVLPAACVSEISGDLQIEYKDDGRLLYIDLEPLSASFGEDDAAAASVIGRAETATGDFPSAPPEDVLDFNLVSDVDTFYRGLTLSRNWRTSRALQARFAFLDGWIGGVPDHLTFDTVSSWGFNREEEAKHRRKTTLTVHVSQGLPTDTLTFTSLDTDQLVGQIRTKPLPDSTVVLGIIVTGPVNADGEYEPSDRLRLNLAHMQAMLALCDQIANQSVKFDFGRKTVQLPGTPEAAARSAASRFTFPLFGFELARIFDQVAVAYMSDANCSGRRMRL